LVVAMNASILLIYTGGTIGMMEDASTGSLIPFDFGALQDFVPELKRFKCNIDVVSFDEPIDSSDVDVAAWSKMARMVEVNYAHYDGFVILHGTDTMAYSASALSYMFENLAKPVLFTGSQLPIGKLRTDGKENLITAIEIAAAKRHGEPIIQEVCVYFEYKLFRGNRTHKYNTENFDAFQSANMSGLAEIGIHIFYHHDRLLRPNGVFAVRHEMCRDIAVLKIFPGITSTLVDRILGTPGLRGVIIETYGSGNAPREQWLISALERTIQAGIVILNVTECNKGFVEQGRYETSTALQRIGVIGGADMTLEAAITKMMFTLAQTSERESVISLLQTNLRGELTTFSYL
jgi:L-asparaginase